MIELLFQTPPGPDAATLAEMLSRPRLEACNEIYCTHRAPQPQMVRDLACTPTDEANVVACRFQRAPAPAPTPVALNAPAETIAPIWSQGRAVLTLHPTGVWLLVSDDIADPTAK